MRFIDVTCLGLAIIGAIGVYHVKHNAEDAQNERVRLERQIAADREAIGLLRTEWSLLNQPERIQRLVAQLQPVIGLQPVTIEQIAGLDELPMRPLDFTPQGQDGRYGGYAGLAPEAVPTGEAVQ